MKSVVSIALTRRHGAAMDQTSQSGVQDTITEDDTTAQIAPLYQKASGFQRGKGKNKKEAIVINQRFPNNTNRGKRKRT